MPHCRRNGGKFGGGHTTFIELAAAIADIAVKLPTVKNVSAGVIHVGADMAGGEQRIKFCTERGCLLLKVRTSRSIQDVRVYTDHMQATLEALVRAALNTLGVKISFQKR